MALIWQGKRHGNYYKVTSAGKSLRLYRNKVFHTQYHPERIITGDIWELLLLASLGIPENARVLLLGLGGGAAVNLLNHFLQPAIIEVVEMDGTIISLCRKHFLQKTDNVVFHEGEASQWLKEAGKNSGLKSYDLVIEDLFGEKAGEPLKAFEFNEGWLNQLSAFLNNEGSLVMNFESRREFNNSPVIKKPKLLNNAGFRSAIRFSSPRYQNNIGLFSRRDITSAQIRQVIDNDVLLKKHREEYFLSQLKLN